MISKIVLRSKEVIKLRAPIRLLLLRFYSEGNAGQSHGSSKTNVNANVPGLSEACIHPSAKPVGPNVDPKKSGAYKVPEYFCYNNMSYFEAEVEMSKYRLPQPSALK